MSDAFRNTVKGWVADMVAQQGTARHGTVSSVDPARGVVKVVWDEFGTVSGWLPIAQNGVGNGWSVVTLPVPGTQVFCVPDMGDTRSMVVVGSVHSSAQPPGSVTPYQGSAQRLTPGEPTLMHASGTTLRLTNGAVEIHGDLRVDGNILASGNVTDLNAIHGSLDVLRQDYVQHRHDGVTTGGSKTGLTDKPTP